ncbi:MAG: Uma2 family endonuclease [Microcystaceae cyanobacterium]
MVISTLIKPLTLKEFLALPETKPAKEYINGEITQKPMPKGRHSRLQGKLCSVINNLTEDAKIAYAFPELRCSFGNRSIVPDIAVFQWGNIPFLANGQVPDRFDLPPDWVIEILSPEQQPNKVIGNILHCMEYGSELGWFIDPNDHSVLSFSRDRQPQLLEGERLLPSLSNVPLQITADNLLAWLKVGSPTIG